MDCPAFGVNEETFRSRYRVCQLESPSSTPRSDLKERVKESYRVFSLVSSLCRQSYLKSERWLPARLSRRGTDTELGKARVTIGIPPVDRIVEVLLIELVDECPAQPVEVRHVEVVLLAERRELAVVGDRVELLVALLCSTPEAHVNNDQSAE